MQDIWYMLQDHGRYVYHYTRAATLTDHILPTGKLRFSRFQYVNDPRESRPWALNFSSDGVVDSWPNAAELNQLLKHSWRIGCFVVDPPDAVRIQNSGDDLFASAYERGHSRPRMWAQYAEDYQGACLVFDKVKLDAEIQNTRSIVQAAGYVEYRNPRVLHVFGQPDAMTISVDEINQLGMAAAVEAHMARHWKDLFFLKARDWEAEREFRWLIRGNGDEDFYVDIRNALVGIALGDRFPDGRKEVVGQYAGTNGVTVAEMTWQNGLPQPHPTNWRLLAEKAVGPEL